MISIRRVRRKVTTGDCLKDYHVIPAGQKQCPCGRAWLSMGGRVVYDIGKAQAEDGGATRA